MNSVKDIMKNLIGNMHVIVLSDKEVKAIKKDVKNICNQKSYENHHQQDSNKRFARFKTGMLGEYAVEKHLDVKFSNRSAGNTRYYSVADMKSIGLDIGIKTSDYNKGNAILIPKNISEPQIITLKVTDNIILIAGYASVDVLKKYSDDSLLKDPNARFRKTGFYGYRFLKKFDNLKELKQLYRN